MKVGDLVMLRPDKYLSGDTLATEIGIIIELDVYGESGLWYRVKWPDEALWHVSSDLEVISESR